MADRRGSAGTTLIVAAMLAMLAIPVPASAEHRARWVNTGPEGAPIFDLELSAGHPSTIYAMSRDTVYRSVDAGASWAPRQTDLYTGPLNLQSLAVSAQHPDIVYVHDGDDLEKTTDGGSTWTTLTNGLPTSVEMNALLVDPTNDQVAYAGGDMSVYKTVDGGANWAPAYLGIASAYVFAMAIDPVNPLVLFAYIGSGARMYKTVDGGASWFASAAGLHDYPEIGQLAVDPNYDQHVFAVAGRDVYRSIDGGAHWTLSSSHVATGSLNTLAVSKADPDTIYVGVADIYNAMPRGIYKSTDAGLTWQAVTHAFHGGALIVDPKRAGVVYAATGDYRSDDLGVLKTTDGGLHWRPRSVGILGTEIDALETAPTDGLTAYAATNGDPGVYRTNDGGGSWSFAGRGLPEPTNELAVSFDNPDLAYAGLHADEPLATHAGVYKTTDGGRTWQPANRGIEDRSVISLVIDPSNPDIVYAGVVDYCGAECDGGSLRKSTDGGATWKYADHDIGLTPYEMAISESDPLTLYYVDSFFVIRTQDGGGSWADVGRIPVQVFSTVALAIDPTDPDTVYAGGWGGIAKSTDGGVSWSMLTTAFDSVNDLSTPEAGEVCAADSGGAWCSTDGGATWVQVQGVSGPLIRIAVGNGRLLYAGTYDHGVAVRRP